MSSMYNKNKGLNLSVPLQLEGTVDEDASSVKERPTLRLKLKSLPSAGHCAAFHSVLSLSLLHESKHSLIL